jgi:hypothetical protein
MAEHHSEENMANFDNTKRSNRAELTNEGGKTVPYEVGYGRPPKDTQFKPGRSGNPLGRPKRALSFAPEIADALPESIIEHDKSITNKLAIVRTAVMGARKDAKAAIEFMQFCEKYARHEADPSAADDDAFVEKLAAGEPGTSKETSTDAREQDEEA